MNLRNEWNESESSPTETVFYTAQETIESVKENFDIRRFYSAEGYSVAVDGITEQVIIQNHSNPINESDVDKKILFSIDTAIHTGSYVIHRDQTWIINSNISIVDDAYKLCQMQLCNYIINFQSEDGAILSYPCITSKVTISENANQDVISLGENKKSILLPYDENTALLKTGDRLFVDKLNKTPYKILGAPDNTTYAYGDKGLLYIIVEQDELQLTGDNPDRPDLGICNYFEPTTTTPTPPEGISYAKLSIDGGIILGGNIRTVTALFYEQDDTTNNSVTAVWDVELPIGYENYFTIEYGNNSFTIWVSDDDYGLINKIVAVNVSDGNGNYAGSEDYIIGSGW